MAFFGLLFLLFLTWKLSGFFHGPNWSEFKSGFVSGFARGMSNRR